MHLNSSCGDSYAYDNLISVVHLPFSRIWRSNLRKKHRKLWCSNIQKSKVGDKDLHLKLLEGIKDARKQTVETKVRQPETKSLCLHVFKTYVYDHTRDCALKLTIIFHSWIPLSSKTYKSWHYLTLQPWYASIDWNSLWNTYCPHFLHQWNPSLLKDST